MTITTRTSLFAGACSLLLVGCEGLPTQLADESDVDYTLAVAAASKAERDVQESLYDLTDTFFAFSCDEQGEIIDPEDGELVRMEGKVYERISIVRDAAGGNHINWHSMPVGLRGIGVSSGEEFRVFERASGAGNQTMSGLTGTYRQELKLIGKDTRRTFWMVFSGNYRIDADDEIIVQRDRERITCKV